MTYDGLKPDWKLSAALTSSSLLSCSMYRFFMRSLKISQISSGTGGAWGARGGISTSTSISGGPILITQRQTRGSEYCYKQHERFTKRWRLCDKISLRILSRSASRTNPFLLPLMADCGLVMVGSAGLDARAVCSRVDGKQPTGEDARRSKATAKQFHGMFWVSV